MSPIFAFFEGLLSPTHILILLVIGILLFGRRLPEMGRSLGKSIVEFKKGLKGIEDDIDVGANAAAKEPAALEPPRPPQRVTTTAPKFEDNAGAITTPPKTP